MVNHIARADSRHQQLPGTEDARRRATEPRTQLLPAEGQFTTKPGATIQPRMRSIAPRGLAWRVVSHGVPRIVRECCHFVFARKISATIRAIRSGLSEPGRRAVNLAWTLAS